jgi:hypothetical protein
LWEGYERSLSRKETITQQVFTRGDADDAKGVSVSRTVKSETVESQPVAYMNALIKVEFLRCKVLGLFPSPGSADEIVLIEGMIQVGLLPDSIRDLAGQKAAEFTRTIKAAIADSSHASISGSSEVGESAHSRQGV